MIELSNLTAQTIEPGQSVTFDKGILKSGNGECFNFQLPQSVKLRCNGIYALSFSGNISAAAANDALQLAIAVGGQPLVETTMNSTPAAANALNNVATSTRFKACCGDLDRVSVQNTGTVALTLAPNSSFIVERRS